MHKTIKFLFVYFILLSFSSMALCATKDQKNQSLAKHARVWNLHQADIRSVIAEVAKETHKNFIIDPRVQGKISIISGRPLSAKELYPVFLSMLQVSGFAAIPTGNVIKIVPNIEARSLGFNLPKQSSDNDDITVQVIPVQFVSSEQLVPILRPLMPQWSNVSAYGPSNMLILSGRTSNIKRLAYIIHQVDTSSAKGIDIVQLHDALAMDVVATLKSLTQNQRPGIRTPEAMIAADDKSNAVLISGSKTQRLRLRVLINQLDRKRDKTMGSYTKVVYLRYSHAADLAPILAGVARANFSGDVGTTIGTVTTPKLDHQTPSNTSGESSDNAEASNSQASNSSLSNNTQSSSQTSSGDSKPKVQIIAEPNTNSIIISGPSTLIRTLRQVISQLDVRPAQVLVEALIAEINENDIQELGIEWGSISPNDKGLSTFHQGFAILNSKTRLSDFQAQLYALEQNQRANILSTPSVVVLDNHQAKILIGKQVSIQDSSYPNNNNGGNPFTTFTRQNVALHLYVRPQISQGTGIQLQIDHGNDTLQDSTNASDARPVINTSSILTSVLVNSGDILVLGGLTQNGLQKSGNKQPILGNLPGIGQLFQRNKRTRDKKVLMVFIRPLILKNQQSGVLVSGEKYGHIRQEQLGWIKKEPFNQDNKEVILPALNEAKLPKPFSSKAKFNHAK